MTYRDGNYSAFYVTEPFSESNLRALATKDFVYYNTLRMWKGGDASFPFIDSHNKNYDVRDGSDWERTLKPRLHERLSNSKNIVLFLSSITKSSRALREEIDYGINTKGLPVIVVYPEYSSNSELFTSDWRFKSSVVALWDKLPVFRDSKSSVPCVHVPMKKDLIREVLSTSAYTVQYKIDPGDYHA